MNIFTIYSYGAGEQTFQALNAIAALFNKDGVFSVLVTLVLALGSIIIAFRIAKGAIEDSGKWLVYIITVTTLVIQPTSKVLVEDPITGFKRQVSNVPIIISITGGMISTAGKAITTAFDTVFSTVTSHQFHKHGFVFGSKLATEMHKLKIMNPEMRDNLHHFIKNCVIIPAMRGDGLTITDLQRQNDIWDFIQEKASNIRMIHYIEQDTKFNDMITCKEAWVKINARWNGEISNVLDYHSTSLSTKKTSKYSAGNNNLAVNSAVISEIKANIQNTYIHLGNIAADANTLVRQQMMINMLHEVPKEEVLRLGGNINFATAKSIVQQRNTFMVSGELAARYLPLVMSIFQIIAFAILPFVICYALLPNGIRVFQNYIEILVWLQMWPPLYAVLNMIMEVSAEMMTGDMLSKGFTMHASIGVANLNSDIISIAGYLSFSIPVIAHMMVQGGVSAFTNIAGSLMSPSQSIAGQAGSELATGNVSFGNYSYGNASAFNNSMFKYDSVASFRGGQQEFLLNDGGYQLTQPDGSAIFKAGAGYNSSTGMTNIRFSGAISSAVSEQLASEESNLNTLSKQYDRAQANEFRSAIDYVDSVTRAYNNNENWTKDDSSTYSKALRDTASLTNTIRDSLGVDSGTSAAFTLGISQELPFNKVLEKITGSRGIAGMELRAIDQLEQKYEHAKDIAKRLDYDISYDKLTRAAHDKNISETGGWDARSSENFSKAYDQRESLNNQTSATYQRINNLRQAKELSESQSVSFDREYNQEYLEYVTNTLDGNRHAAYKLLNSDSPEAQALQNEFVTNKTNALVNQSIQQGSSIKEHYDKVDIGQLYAIPKLQVSDNIIEQKTFENNLQKHKVSNPAVSSEINNTIQEADKNISINSTNIQAEEQRLTSKHSIIEHAWKKKEEN